MNSRFYFHESILELDLKNGGKICSLRLLSTKTIKQREIIKSHRGNFFLSGSYLLYPWVNRIQSKNLKAFGRDINIQTNYLDSNQNPIHGLVFNTERKLIRSEINQNGLEIVLGMKDNPKNFPICTEKFILGNDNLTIKTGFYNNTENLQYFSYGYHPYFSLGVRTDTLYLETSLNDLIPLNHNFLPKSYTIPDARKYIFSNFEILGNKELDHCITSSTGNIVKPYIKISNSGKNESIMISSRVSSEKHHIPLRFYQIYTPPDRQSIAIEPMSSPGNIFNSHEYTPTILYPGEYKEGEFCITYS